MKWLAKPVVLLVLILSLLLSSLPSGVVGAQSSFYTPELLSNSLDLTYQSNSLGAICADRFGRLWIPQSNGIYYVTTGGTTQYLSLDAQSGAGRSCVMDGDTLYVVTTKRVFLIDTASMTNSVWYDLPTTVTGYIYGQTIKIPGKPVLVLRVLKEYYRENLYVINKGEPSLLPSGYYASAPHNVNSIAKEIYYDASSNQVYFAAAARLYAFSLTTSQLTDLGSTVYDVASFFYEPATAFLQTSYSGSPTARRYYQNNEGKLFYVGTQVSIGVLTIRLANQPRQSPSVILPSNWVFDFNAAWVTVSPDGKLYVMGHNAKYSTNGGSTWTTHTTYRFSPPRSVKVSGLPSRGWVQSARITLSVINQPSGYSLRYRVGQGDWTVTTSNPAQITVTTSGTLEYEVYSDSSPVFSGTAMISWVDSLPPDPPENVSAGGIETECRSDVDQYPITWQPPSTIRLPLTHYEVFDGTGLYSVSVPEITVNGLSYGVHFIRVRSVNPNGVSSWSEVQICRALSGKVFDAVEVGTETMSLGNGQALSLTVSPKAVQYQPTLFMVYPATNPTLPSGKIAVVSPLHLEARRQSDGEIISLFDEPILVSFTYNEADLQGINPRQLSVYYHDPLGEWVKIPSIVDVSQLPPAKAGGLSLNP